jgi:hypothetical protein
MAARKKSKKTPELVAQPDPNAPLDGAQLLKAAAPLLKQLSADLLTRADGSASVTAALKERHASWRTAAAHCRYQSSRKAATARASRFAVARA